MTRYSLVCLLLGTFLCSQTMISQSALQAQEPAVPPNASVRRLLIKVGRQKLRPLLRMLP